MTHCSIAYPVLHPSAFPLPVPEVKRQCLPGHSTCSHILTAAPRKARFSGRTSAPESFSMPPCHSAAWLQSRPSSPPSCPISGRVGAFSLQGPNLSLSCSLLVPILGCAEFENYCHDFGDFTHTRSVFTVDVRGLGLEVHLSCLLRGGYCVLDPLF
jgi:hypothetical protein